MFLLLVIQTANIKELNKNSIWLRLHVHPNDPVQSLTFIECFPHIVVKGEVDGG